MTETKEKRVRNLKRAFYVTIIVWISVFILGAIEGYVNHQFFESIYNNSISIYSSVIQGMSALAGITIAVIIFRIQGLESRKQELEKYTIDYAYRLNHWVYTSWNENLANSLKNKEITKRYLENRLNNKILFNEYGKERLEKDADKQQQGLMDNLNKHNDIEEIIEKTKSDFRGATIFLLSPIILSLIMIIFPFSGGEYGVYGVISIIILDSIIGIFRLIEIVLNVTTEDF